MFPAVDRIYRSHLAMYHVSEESRRICDMMQHGQHVEIDYAIFDFASDLALDHANHYRGCDGGVAAADGARLFSDVLILSMNVHEGAFRPDTPKSTVVFIYCRQNENGEEWVFKAMVSEFGIHFDGTHSSLAVTSGWRPGKQGFYPAPLLVNAGMEQSVMIQEALQDGFLLSVINQDRFVCREAAHTRQQKRSLERSIGFAPVGWYRVSWNIGEDVKAKVAQSDPANAMPLHFCRAHWRKAKKGQPKAIARNDEPGWWCWVSECWKGHPAFGVRLHHYSPKLKVA